MSTRFAAMPLMCLLILFLVHSSHIVQSNAIVLAAADGPAVPNPADPVMENDADESEDDDTSDSNDEPAVLDPPVVIDPKGEEDASGYVVPDPGSPLFFDSFQSGLSKWLYSSDTMYNGKFAVGQGAKPTFKGDRALIIPEKAKHYAISTKVDGLENPAQTDVVIQYEVKIDNAMTCGGAYLKIPTTGFKPSKFDGTTPYSVMFGPDKCGGTDKVHFIFQSKNPVSGKLTEHHMNGPPPVANSFDQKTHIYTLYVSKNSSFKLLIDGEIKKEGTLSEDFEPSVQPLKDIADSEDTKPADWVDDAKISDPKAVKPANWDEDAPKRITDKDAVKPKGWLDDEPEKAADPKAKKPEGWNEEEDGEWETPLIPNPKCEAIGCGEWKKPMKDNPAYKGKWIAPLIDNSKYVGIWKPRQIPNKDYYENLNPSLLPIEGVGLEIWTMDQGVLFDNIWIGSSIEDATKFADATFKEKHKKEVEEEEKENAEREKSGAESKASGRMASALSQIEKVLHKLEVLLEPVESFFIQYGAEPLLDKLIDYGIDKPMLVVVLVPLFIVLVLLVVLSTSKSSRPPPPAPTESETTEASSDVAIKKKTDDPTPDDAGKTVGSVAKSKEDSEKTIRKRQTAAATESG